jgi:rare lipoprotein A (peptidoglycan hydrolase)
VGRDPKLEAGGLNLYGFCRNNSINLWDVLGMSPDEVEHLLSKIAKRQDDLDGMGSEFDSTKAANLEREIADFRAELTKLQSQMPVVPMAPFIVNGSTDDGSDEAPNSGLDPNFVGAALANAPQLAASGPVAGGSKATVTITGGTATYYNPTGNRAADGSVYDGKGMTAAVNAVISALGTVMTVTGTYNGVTNTITVTITDRMPTRSLEKGAVIDLSPAAFNALFGPGTATPSGPGRVPVVVTFPGSNGNQIVHLPDWLVPAQPTESSATNRGPARGQPRKGRLRLPGGPGVPAPAPA